MKEKAIAVSGREEKNNQPAPKNKLTSPNSKCNSYFFFFCPLICIWEGTTQNFTFLSWQGTADRDLKIWLQLRILTFAHFYQFSQAPMCRFCSERDVLAVLILVLRNCRGGNIIFALPIRVSAWLRPFFSRAPRKWINLSRLKVF